MYALRHRSAVCAQLAHARRHAAASAFIPHGAPRTAQHSAACARAVHSAEAAWNSQAAEAAAASPVDADATDTVTPARAPSAAAADAAAADAAEAAAAAGAPGAKAPRKRSWKIYATSSERRKAIDASIEAEKVKAADAVANSDAAAEAAARAAIAEYQQAHADEEAETQAETGTANASAAPEEHVLPGKNADMSESQVRGILAKRAALQALHPFRMLLTSPRHGLDKVRIIPVSLQNRIDHILKSNRFLAGQNDVTQSKDYPLWHVANRSAIEFGVLTRVFDEIVKRLPSLNPHSVLDYGAATNMSLLALMESLQNYSIKDLHTGKLERPVRTYRVIEHNSGLAKYGTQLSSELTQNEQIDVKYRANLPALPTATNPTQLEQSSIVVAPFSLGLIDQKDKRHKALDVLWASVEAGGVLVLVEGGSIENFTMVREAREYLLDHHGLRSMAQRVRPGANDTAAHVVAPCGSNGVCPMGDLTLKRSCWHRTEILTSSLPLRTPQKHLRAKDGVTVETFSYLVVHKGPVKVTVRDAERALLKWQPKAKDLTEVGQQGWLAIARRESFDLQERLAFEEEERKYNDPDAVPYYPFNEDGIVPEPNTEAAAAAAAPAAEPIPFAAVDAESASKGTETEGDADATSGTADSNTPPPVTKRTELSSVAHLLPSATVPANVMFEHSYARILRKPMKRGEHVILELCNEDAQIERRIVAKSWGVPYTLARTVDNGDLWAIKKRVRDPTEGMTVGQRRRAELKARKEKRAAAMEGMTEEEQELAKQELNARKAAEKVKKTTEKTERVATKLDAIIVSRGGEARDRTKATDHPEREEPSEILFMDEGDLDAEGEMKLAKMRIATLKPVPPPAATKKEKEKLKKAAAPIESIETPAEAPADQAEPKEDSDAAAPTASTDSPSTTVAAAPTKQPKVAKAKKPKKVVPLESDSAFSTTGGVSRMPNWMTSIMSKTKRADGGGLEYTGSQMPRMRKEDAEEDDEEGEYTFAPDPTIAAAAALNTTAPTPVEIEQQKRIEIEKEHKEQARRLTEKDRREKSPLMAKRNDAPTEADEDVWTPAPLAVKVAAPVAAPKPVAAVATPKPVAATPPVVKERRHPTFSVGPPTSAHQALAALGEVPASLVDAPTGEAPVRLPKWSKYRAIKQTEPIAATPDNTASWPRDNVKDAVRNVPTTDPEWEAIMAAHRKPEAPHPGLLSWHKRDEIRRRQAKLSPPTAQTSAPTPAAPSTLPPHLAALKAAALRSPANARISEQSEQTRQYRDNIEHESRDKRAPRNGSSSGGDRSASFKPRDFGRPSPASGLHKRRPAAPRK